MIFKVYYTKFTSLFTCEREIYGKNILEKINKFIYITSLFRSNLLFLVFIY